MSDDLLLDSSVKPQNDNVWGGTNRKRAHTDASHLVSIFADINHIPDVGIMIRYCISVVLVAVFHGRTEIWAMKNEH